MDNLQEDMERLALLNADDLGYKLSVVKGVPQNPTFDVQQFEDLIETFPSTEEDVFVCTFVKAGTTWTQQILKLLIDEGQRTAVSYGEVVPWLEALTSSLLASREAPGNSLDDILSRKGRRYFKTHATVNSLPGGLETGAKVIYVARNPKDTVVSLYHHARNKPEFGFQGTFEEMLKLFVAGKAENGSWFEHVLPWYEQSLLRPDQVLFIKYEDMYEDTTQAVRAISDFLGFGYSDDVIESVVQGSSLQTMKSENKSNIGFNHLRQGGTGAWRSTFTVEQSEFFDAVYRIRMRGTDLKFNFGRGLVL
jgi:hypothetical protein